MDLTSLTTSASVDLEVVREQERFVSERVATATISNVTTSTILFLGMLTWLPWQPMAVWLVWLNAVALLRFALLRGPIGDRLRQSEACIYLKISTGLGLVMGLSWASVAIMLWVKSIPLTYTIYPFVITAFCGGSVAVWQAHSRTTIATIAPLLLTLAFTLAPDYQLMNVLLAGGVVFYLVILISTARSAEKSFRSATELAIRNGKLIQSLQVASTQAEAARSHFALLARKDSLTNLGNRLEFNEALDAAFAPGRAPAAALLLLDLDDFKSVNDNLGHHAGDTLLREVGQRLLETCPQGVTVSRFGGDEFAVLLQRVEDISAVDEIAGALLRRLAEPVVLDGHPVCVNASMGVAIAPRDATNDDDLLTCADLALYKAKADGRARIVCFDQDLRSTLDRKRVLERDLGSAIRERQLEVYFQPQLDLLSRQVIGFEALLRWNHASAGWVSPPDIVHAAQAQGLSEPLNALVIDEALRMLQHLQASDRDSIRVAVNISPRDLISLPFDLLVKDALNSYQVVPSNFEIEITEEVMLDAEAARPRLSALEALGVRLTLDDFGVGYSSLSYLSEIKFDCIKVDRRFTDNMLRSEGDLSLMRAMLAVGDSLGQDVVAEGIEDRAQAQILGELGFKVGQGYYFAKPMPARHVMPWLNNRTITVEQDVLILGDVDARVSA